MLTLPTDWTPIGVDFLEPAALNALHHSGCSSVVAGPGAGKTEFLAQRATYLLQTGLCPPPHKILAISFKTDAAHNLNKRVRQRCPQDQADRFVSLTFDAFTKGLVDRFHSAIPEHWRPTYPYEITFPNTRGIREYLAGLQYAIDKRWHSAIMAINPTDFESTKVGAYKLTSTKTKPTSISEYAIIHWLSDNLFGSDRSLLTFVMLNRLAELLIRTNPQIRRAIRLTFPFVFVDEFQDTTFGQYDFLVSAFSESSTTVTVVGDDKQRIMVWAGARKDCFVQFEEDFNAERFHLLANFRSSPELVRIQHVVARALDANVAETLAYARQEIDSNVAQIWIHQTKTDEAQKLADWLTQDIPSRNKKARDYAILVRQKADDYEQEFAKAFTDNGLRLRNESRIVGRISLQDLFAEELTEIGIALLQLGVHHRHATAWELASTANRHLRAVDNYDEIACQHAQIQLDNFLMALRSSLATSVPTTETANGIAQEIVRFLEPTALARTYVRYSTGDSLNIAIEGFTLHLQSAAEEADDWQSCLDIFEGTDQIPLMTVHKSKGLEFDTILFVGLDDRAWWSYSQENPEGMATFFVALSRAKQRAIFSYCSQRGSRQRIDTLYRLLWEAGVPEFQY